MVEEDLEDIMEEDLEGIMEEDLEDIITIILMGLQDPWLSVVDLARTIMDSALDMALVIMAMVPVVTDMVLDMVLVTCHCADIETGIFTNLKFFYMGLLKKFRLNHD